jgi:hypothetical protein
MSGNDGPRFQFISSMAAGKTAATIPPKASSAADEKGAFGHDVDSIYDEEEIPATRESDFKHKQVSTGPLTRGQLMLILGQIFKGWSLLLLARSSEPRESVC